MESNESVLLSYSALYPRLLYCVTNMHAVSTPGRWQARMATGCCEKGGNLGIVRKYYLVVTVVGTEWVARCRCVLGDSGGKMGW